MADQFNILVAHSDFPQAGISLFTDKYNVKIMDSPFPSVPEILNEIPNYDALLGRVQVDSKFLDAAGSRLKVISTPSAGYDHMDVKEIKKRGIRVGYTPKILSAAVAELAIFLVIGAARRANEGRILLEKGEVEHGFQWLLGHDMRNKTAGIVGLGNIGVEIVKRLKAFEINKFLYSGHSRKKIGDALNAEFVDLDELLRRSDLVFCAVSLNPETTRMFNDATFKKMKKSAVFVNVSRGSTVDTEALVRALKNGTIFAAGLDVTDPEPLPVDHELLKLPNALITPHMGSSTVETSTDIAMIAAQNVINALENKKMIYEL